MGKSFQAVWKNTFISIIAEDAKDSQPVPMRRSKSVESIRNRPEAKQFQEWMTQQSLQRLNAALSMGISPLEAKSQEDKSINGGFSLRRGKAGNGFTAESWSSVSELRLLQARLAKALDSPKHPQKVCDKICHVSSSCSLSTMAHEFTSESEESIVSDQGRMPKVWSSGSVSSLVSDWNDCFYDEGGQVEFELDIQELNGPKMTHDTSSVTTSTSAHISGSESKMMTCQTSSDIKSTSISTSYFLNGGQALMERSHHQVPRKENMKKMYDDDKETPPTTMMIRNVPGRYTQNDLMKDLQRLGFTGTYNFLYIPIDKHTAANVGYAFVNFVDHVWAQSCAERFEGYRFFKQQRSSNKVGSVSVAFLQGLEKNLQHYEHSAVNMSRNKRGKPVVIASIA